MLCRIPRRLHGQQRSEMEWILDVRSSWKRIICQIDETDLCLGKTMMPAERRWLAGCGIQASRRSRPAGDVEGKRHDDGRSKSRHGHVNDQLDCMNLNLVLCVFHLCLVLSAQCSAPQELKRLSA